MLALCVGCRLIHDDISRSRNKQFQRDITIEYKMPEFRDAVIVAIDSVKGQEVLKPVVKTQLQDIAIDHIWQLTTGAGIGALTLVALRKRILKMLGIDAVSAPVITNGDTA